MVSLTLLLLCDKAYGTVPACYCHHGFDALSVYPALADFSFRLLRLKEPARSDTSIAALEIELFEAPLADPPAFEAVSYAWDHADAQAVLICNDQQLHVSPAVFDMIGALSRLSMSGVFWIDAVWIDQSSVFDKNIQVPRMRNIFSEAFNVWIWLGQGLPEMKIALDLLVDTNRLLEESNDVVRDMVVRIQRYQGKWIGLLLVAERTYTSRYGPPSPRCL